MAQDNEWWKLGATAVESAGAGDWWKQGGTAVDAPTTPKRSLAAVANDTVIEVANAAVGGLSSAANFIKPGNAVSGWLDENIIKAGEAKQSDAVKAEKQRFGSEMESAEGIGQEAAAVLGYASRNPLLAAAQAAGSFAVPGAAVKGASLMARGAGLVGKAVGTAGRAGGVAAGAALAGGDAAGTAHELATQAGATEDQAVATGRQASVIPALVGGVGGAFGAEKLLAGAKGFTGGVAARALKTGASEAAQEAIEESVTQYEGQRAAVPYDASIDPTKGVAGAGVLGAVLGGSTGAGMGALDGLQHRARERADARARQQAETEAAAAGPQWSTSLGAAEPNAQPQQVPQADGLAEFEPAFTTLPGAAAEREPGVEFTREVDTAGLALEDPAELERARAATIDFEQEQDTTPAWDTTLGAGSPARADGLSLPSAEIDTGGLAIAEGSPAEATATPESVADTRPASQRMGIDPAAGPLSKAAAQAVDTQEAAQAQVAQQAQAADPAATAPNTNPRAAEMPEAGTGPLTQATGVKLAPQTDQAQQATAQPSQTGSTPGAIAPVAGSPTHAAVIGQPAQAAPVETTQAGEAGAQVRQGLAPAATAAQPAGTAGTVTPARPDGWRTNLLKAGPIAEALGIDRKGKRVAQVVAEIDAADAQRAGTAQDGADLSAGQIDHEWSAFAPETGTLGIPRAQMPQVKAEHRGALVNFLKAKGVGSRSDEVPANDLKPTQAEFSQAKVNEARGFKGSDRSILVSSDGYVVDGHHQWLAKRADGKPVKVTRLQAPIRELLAKVAEFPSTGVSDGAQAGPRFEQTGVADAARTLKEADVSAMFGSKPWTSSTGTARIVETTHPQMGHALFVVQPTGRLDRGDRDALNDSAKQMGGRFSALKTNGAKPGFQFRSRASAEAFAAQMEQSGVKVAPPAPPADELGMDSFMRTVDSLAFSRSQQAMSPELAAELLRIRMPATVDSVRAAIREVVPGGAMLPNRLGSVVVATAAEIKSQWEPLIGPVAMEATGDAGKAQGFYDPRTKTVFLIADHIQRGDEVGVVAHELMHKHGQAVLGEDGWNQLHGAIEGWANAAEGSLERRVFDEAAARVSDSQPADMEAQAYSSQELFPYAVQVSLEMGVRPSLLAKPGTVARWLGQVKAALRQVWQKVVGSRGDFNSQDLVNLAFGIAQRENPAHAGELDGAIAPLRTATTFLQARQAVKAFQGKQLTNAATGMTAVVSRNSLDKMLSGKAVKKSETPATHSMAVANADSLFERAVWGWSKPDRADDPSISAVHRFFAPMDVNGRTKLVKLTVKETRQVSDGNPLYTVEAVELNESLPGKAWIEAAASEDGVSLDNKNPLQRGVGGRKDQMADPRPTLAQPHGVNPDRSAEDVLSLAQDVERSNSGQDRPQFSFAGANARTADQGSLVQARQRIAAGEDAEAIRQETGWHRGADGQWRFEIDDSQAQLLTRTDSPDHYADVWDEASQREGGMPLGRMLDHPKLFAAYPQLKGVRVLVDPAMKEDGRFSDGDRPTITVKDPFDYAGGMDTLKSVLLHELQHAIQRSEGFATGGSPSMFTDADGSSSFGRYERLAGEVEARNTQTRLGLSEAERRATAPAATEDVAETDQLVAFSSGSPQFSSARYQDDSTTWSSPSASKWDDAVYKLQDKHVDTKRALAAMRSAGKAIADDLDVYLQEELYHGRVAKRTEDFITQEMEPLMKYLAGANLKMQDVERYLHARHAREANRVIAQRNPELPDGGSGMTNAEAEAVLASFTGLRRQHLENAASRVDAIIAGTRQTRVQYGLESQAAMDDLAKTFAHYVPLRRDDIDGPSSGQGFSIKGKEMPDELGSTAPAVNILASVALERESAIVRGEKNRVATALVGLAQANPNAAFWQVDTAPTRQVLAKDGKVATQKDSQFKDRDNVLVAKIQNADGTVSEHAVVFNEKDARAMRMVQSLKNLDAAQMEGLLGATAKMTRYLAAINTQYNPIFSLVNLVRDVQGAALNLASTPLAGKQRQVLGQTASALAAIYGHERANSKGKVGKASEWTALWEEFQQVGGQTGYRDQFRTSTDRGEALARALDPSAWAESKWGRFFTAGGRLKVPLEMARKALAPVLAWLDDYNNAMENGVRLATYKAGLDAGLSKERAASLAKNLTTNFNRKGQVATQTGALYAFFNASMQGTARIGETLFDMVPGKPKTLRLSAVGRKVVAGGVLLGSMQAMLLAAAGFDDEEPPDFVRERNLVIPTGGKTYVTIPMPLGFHVLPNLGRLPVEFAMGGFKKPAEFALRLMGLFSDTFNPIGNAGLSMQTVAPTVLDPFVALRENVDFSGRAIAKESFNKLTPGHALGRDSASAPAQWLSEAINYLTGGTQYVRGALSPTPDQIDYLVGQVTGGVGREASKVRATVEGLAQGDDVPTHEVPVLGRLFGNADSPGAKQSAYYRTMDEVRRHAEEVKGLRQDGKASEASAYLQEHPSARFALAASAAERQVKALRDRRRALEEEGAERSEIRVVEQRMVERMEAFTVLVNP